MSEGNIAMLPTNVDRRCCLLYVVPYNKSLNDCSREKKLILFSLNPNVSSNFHSGKHWDFPEGTVIMCLLNIVHNVTNRLSAKGLRTVMIQHNSFLELGEGSYWRQGVYF